MAPQVPSTGTRKRPPARQAGQTRRFDGALLDVQAAAELLGCSPKTLRARVARRLVPFRRLGGRVLFKRAELLEFIDALDGVSVNDALTNIKAHAGR